MERLSVMDAMGFAIETNGGSAFAFSKEGYGRVVVHKLHPDSALQANPLRNIGTQRKSGLGGRGRTSRRHDCSGAWKADMDVGLKRESESEEIWRLRNRNLVG
jgi:hypothetical protein